MPGSSAQLAAAIDKYGRGQRSVLVVYPANHRSFKVTLEPAMSGSGIFAARIPAESVADGGGLSAAGWTLEELDRMGNFYRRHFLADGGSPEAVASAIEQAYALLGLPAAIGSWVVWPLPRVSDEVIDGYADAAGAAEQKRGASGLQPLISALLTALAIMWTLSFLFSLPGDLIGLGRDVIGILHTPGVSLVSILGGVALVVFGIWLVGRVLGTGGSDTTAFGMDPRLAAALGAAAMTFGALAVYAGLT